MVPQNVMDGNGGFAAGGVPASALAFVRMAPAIHSALAEGGVALVDDVDSAGMDLAERFIDMFTEPPLSPGTNPKKGQIWAATRIATAAEGMREPSWSGGPRAAMVRCGREGQRGNASDLSAMALALAGDAES